MSKRLTVDDVNEVAFSAVRFREGYDMKDVDDFLDQVTFTIGDMERELESLRAENAALRNGH